MPQVQQVEVPPALCLMIDGQGDPNAAPFQQAVAALYAFSYTLRFWTKKHQTPPGWVDFKVQPLEGLWSVPGVDVIDAMNKPRDLWRWTALIKQPGFVTPTLMAEVLSAVADKKPGVDTSALRLEMFDEGSSVEIMHHGPYATELVSIQALETFMKEHKLVSNGRHHEIYLSDPQKTVPEKLKTILRHPVKSAVRG